MEVENTAINDGPFEGLNPQIIITLLLKLPAAECLNGRAFYKSYKKWEDMNPDQRTKTVIFWEKNINTATREALLRAARTELVRDTAVEKERQAITNKHDKARVLHLRVDPCAQADWTSALREKSRAELDFDEGDNDPWNRLASKFNDCETFKYTNAVVQPGRFTAAGLPVAVVGMESLLNICFDINPCMPDRPLRDAGWLRTIYRELKSKISVCFSNYHRSGNQDAENEYDEWLKFAVVFNNDIVVYARAVLNENDMNQLGKLLPVDSQRDTGALDPEDTYERRKEAAEARKRQRRAALASPSGSSGGANDSAAGTTVSQALQLGMGEANRIAAITALIDRGSDVDKEQGLDALRAYLPKL